ncbi:MAG TPA: MlaD family protein [Candidatus Binatia bacterium]|jgi:phospholipid/cholesterol/gamma-HCH transport system substrate-binding protein|nr:MlaD family protein [Candidatus Binatia bacterium]
MKKLDAELVVGCMLLLVVGVLVYVSVSLGNLDITGSWGYAVQADFSTAGGLQPGAVIELAGVEIGRVEAVDLADYHARVTLKIRRDIALSKDVQAGIKSKGLIGERYVEIVPGKVSDQLQPGERIRNTESPVDIQELIAKFIFGNVEKQAEE